jgi:hypothetical protein
VTSLALGHYLRLYDGGANVKYSFQNFYIAENVSHEGINYDFVPFGFSGTSATRQGDLQPATLTFPNNEVSRAILGEALRGRTLRGEYTWVTPYVAEVDVNILSATSNQVIQKLLTYTGQSTAGGWDDTVLRLELSSVLDAAGLDIPTRTLHRRLVGSLPTTSSVRLR